MFKSISIIGLILLSLGMQAQQVNTYTGTSFSYAVYIDTSKCTSNGDEKVDSIVIKDVSGSKSLQHIKVNTPYRLNCTTDVVAASLFNIEDVNFDGHEDIMLMQYVPADANLPYYWWVYNSTTRQFEEDTALEKIKGPIFNAKEHSITCRWSEGCCHNGVNTYHFINGKIKLTEKEEYIHDENTMTDTTIKRQIINGQLKEISRNVKQEG